MDFGRIKNIETIDFSLPVDNINNQKVLHRVNDKPPMIYVGCPVWADKKWIGKIYPDDAQEKYFLRYYAQQFNCIELNATHYKIPGASSVQRWKGMTSADFKFCPKVPQVISHATNIIDMKDVMAEFIDAVIYFDNNLGTTFLQLPPHFSTKRLQELIVFLSLIEKPIKLAVELRHQSWFSDKAAFEELCDFLMENDHSLVITDVSGRRDVLHQRLTNKTAFIRFGGNDLHPTDYKRLDDWVNRCLYWIENGLEEIYFFVHTPDKSLCPEMANYFIEKFNKNSLVKIKPVSINKSIQQGVLF